MNLSNIIGKQVFEIYSGKIIGTVHDIAFNEKYTKLLGLYFFDQDENEYFIKTQNIYSILDFVVVKNASKISNEFLLNKPLSPLGKQIVDVIGKDYGFLNDIEFDENYNLVYLITANNKLELSTMISISNCIVVGKNQKLSDFKPKLNPKHSHLNNLTVNIMKIEEDEPNLKLMPSKITVNSDILIGKRLSKNIIGKNNELILKQNQVITPKQLILAKQHDKLNELFYSVY